MKNNFSDKKSMSAVNHRLIVCGELITQSFSKSLLLALGMVDESIRTHLVIVGKVVESSKFEERIRVSGLQDYVSFVELDFKDKDSELFLRHSLCNQVKAEVMR